MELGIALSHVGMTCMVLWDMNCLFVSVYRVLPSCALFYFLLLISQCWGLVFINGEIQAGEICMYASSLNKCLVWLVQKQAFFNIKCTLEVLYRREQVIQVLMCRRIDVWFRMP
ncbi:hypothetical protein QBC41DRAFT_319558 [Cercophora samala]|uniref:Uncharacterized protein n=1 Tax=Cercophora samala TaxID=330535 RepID=A0AA40DC20_9PEZI|nr:hypothetical protein QBC41DRAFT_319558 [Cercophora samala]